MGAGESLYCQYDDDWQAYSVIDVRRMHMENPEHVMTPDATGKLPIHYAVEHGAKFEVVRYISNLNPEGLQTQDLHGKKIPLHYAAELGHDHLIPYLLYSYLEGKEIKTANQQTALDLAQQFRFPKAIEQLENSEQTVETYSKQEKLMQKHELVRRNSDIIQAEENEELQRLLAQHDKGQSRGILFCCSDDRDDEDLGIDQRAEFNSTVGLTNVDDAENQSMGNKEKTEPGDNIIESKDESDPVEVTVPTDSEGK